MSKYKSDVQITVEAVLNAMQHNEPFVQPRLKACLDVMERMESFEHLRIVMAIFHVPEEEVQDDAEKVLLAEAV